MNKRGEKMTKGIERKEHPELHEGEVFLTNSTLKDYPRICWKTKRSGMIAYDINGVPVKDLMPVFVQQSEISKDGEDK